MTKNLSPTRRAFLGGWAAGALLGQSREYQRSGMLYRPLGKTGMDVSLLSFGSHTDIKDRKRVSPAKTVLTPEGQARRDRIIDKALDRGVNLLDVYESEGQWEPAAKLVREKRGRVLISLAHEVKRADLEKAARMFGHIDLYRFHAGDINTQTLEDWDMLRKAKEAGLIRAIGIATHIERVMTRALDELDGLDFIIFPYNFIHARADYGEFLPRARAKGVGLIAMKPLASGSIMRLDPRARAGAAPEFEALQLWQRRNRPILPAAVAELTKSLDRLPDETLCMAAMRFVYGKQFLATALTGIFEEQLLDDNLQALARYRDTRPEERSALDAARQVAVAAGPSWLPRDYRWLDERWRS